MRTCSRPGSRRSSGKSSISPKSSGWHCRRRSPRTVLHARWPSRLSRRPVVPGLRVVLAHLRCWSRARRCCRRRICRPRLVRLVSASVLLACTFLYALIAEVLVGVVSVVLNRSGIDERFLGVHGVHPCAEHHRVHERDEFCYQWEYYSQVRRPFTSFCFVSP